jgi:hypothetical protein
MTIFEAFKEGGRFKRKGSSHWLRAGFGPILYQLNGEDIAAEDWEIEHVPFECFVLVTSKGELYGYSLTLEGLPGGPWGSKIIKMREVVDDSN